ncbi:hypothetical protein [Streptomyces sp. ISL-94]|uniref:hypothetical protein n=1 Tax=Streptomyces sp. ISL-94 TaxID=2819190 RepID=UPI001BEB1418|nr:hypothetical protein [Streptomyces sp. ISL-94]MBT2482724.1 hypothetical protein [Streptomyces sp. ISL-94]
MSGPRAPVEPPADWSLEPPASEPPDTWTGSGFYGAVLLVALVNATLLWAPARALVPRRRAGTRAEGEPGGQVKGPA